MDTSEEFIPCMVKVRLSIPNERVVAEFEVTSV